MKFKTVIPAVLIAILSAYGQSPITITRPNGGETYYQGDTLAVKWTTAAGISIVNITLSLDSGETYKSITPKSVMSGGAGWENYSWPIPDSLNHRSTISRQCRIRIYNYLNGSQEDETDAFFTIAAPAPPAPQNDSKSGCGSGASLSLLPLVGCRYISRKKMRQKAGRRTYAALN